MKFVDAHERFADGLINLEQLAVIEERIYPQRVWDVAQENITNWLSEELEFSEAKPAAKADLLRCVAGCPHEPVTLPASSRRCVACGGKGWSADTSAYVTELSFDEDGTGTMATVVCGSCGGRCVTDDGPCPWLTPNVVALAQAAYEDRLDDGTLDPFRLALLADALEEAGCPQEVESYGEIECPECEGAGEFCGNYAADDGMEACERCGGRGVVDGDRLDPHPMLAHLRSPGPHVRGCHVVDLILGKEQDDANQGDLSGRQADGRDRTVSA